MSSKVTSLVLSLGLALAGGAALAGPDDTSAALNACASGLPDHTRIIAGVTAAGFQDLGIFPAAGQDMRMFVSADGKTYVGTRGETETGVRCMILEDKLSVRRAEGMAAGLAKLMPGAVEQPGTKGQGIEMTKSYAGMYRDTATILFVLRSYEIKDVKGAALLVMVQ